MKPALIRHVARIRECSRNSVNRDISDADRCANFGITQVSITDIRDPHEETTVL